MGELEIVILGHLPQLERLSMFNLVVVNTVDLEALFRHNLKYQS